MKDAMKIGTAAAVDISTAPPQQGNDSAWGSQLGSRVCASQSRGNEGVHEETWHHGVAKHEDGAGLITGRTHAGGFLTR